MREGWAVDSLDYPPHNVAYPFLVNDDGSEKDPRGIQKEYQSRCDLMYNNDTTNFGEKPVSHIKVIANQLSGANGSQLCDGLPLEATYVTPGANGWYWTHQVETWVNGFREKVYKHRGSSPSESDCWYEHTYNVCRVSPKGSTKYYFVTYTDGIGHCSDSYGREYNRKDPYNPGTCQRYVKRHAPKGELFVPSGVTPEYAQSLYEQLAPNHTAPPGLMSEMFREAMNSITCNTNSIANIAEMVKLIKDIKSGRLVKSLKDIGNMPILQTASSAWMGYRYSYTTTKSDIEEYSEKVGKLINYDYDKSHIVRSGISTDSGVGHCKVVYTDIRQNEMCELHKKLKRAGLALDAYNVWDMVPLSFVVDWFLPIGDFLEDLSSNWVSSPGYFSFSAITTSWKWVEQISTSTGQVTVSAYQRGVTTKPPEFMSFSEDPSKKTVVKRFIDGGCLLIG